eukprot:6194158-Pleurochrysis_carterae.AAC.2
MDVGSAVPSRSRGEEVSPATEAPVHLKQPPGSAQAPLPATHIRCPSQISSTNNTDKMLCAA